MSQENLVCHACKKEIKPGSPHARHGMEYYFHDVCYEEFRLAYFYRPISHTWEPK